MMLLSNVTFRLGVEDQRRILIDESFKGAIWVVVSNHQLATETIA
jgi:hypothetical protein